MAKTFRTVGSGSSQTLHQIEDEKIPIYATKAAADADLANLAVGQIVGTKDGSSIGDTVVVRKDVAITGTANVATDIQTLVNDILATGAGTYSGEFKRGGYSYGSYILTYFVDSDDTDSVSGIVTEAISDDNDSNWRVSYVKQTGQSAVWNIEKDVVKKNYTISSPNADPIVDIRSFANAAYMWPTGTYTGYFQRAGSTSGHYSFSVVHGWSVTGNVVLVGGISDNFSVSSTTTTYEGALTHTILPSRTDAMNLSYVYPAGTNMYSTIDTTAGAAQYTTFRFYCSSALYTPYGNNMDVDFFITVMKIDNYHYQRVIAYDIRTNNIYTTRSYDDGNGNTVWAAWDPLHGSPRFSSYNSLTTTMQVTGSWQLIPIGNIVFNDDTSRYGYDSVNRVVTIVKPGIYTISAQVHGAISAGSVLRMSIHNAGRYFEVSNPTSSVLQFQSSNEVTVRVTDSGFATGIGIVAVAGSGEVYEPSATHETNIVITQIG